MSRKAVIGAAGLVENVIEADDGFTLPGKTLIAALDANPGDTWDGAQFVKPPAPAPSPVPQSVTPRQARLALLDAGLLDAVNTAVAAAGAQAQIDWDYALEIRRDNALIASMAAGLGLTSEQIDNLFRAAAAL